MRFTAIGAFVLFILAAVFMHSPVLHAQSNHSTITIQRGDTLSGIASQYGSTVQQLVRANSSVTNPDLIYAGQQLRIPQGNRRAIRSSSASTSVGRRASQRPAVSQAGTASQSTAATHRSVWDRLAQCESSGNWSINTGNGFYGGLQFTLSSWQAVGGTGYPHHASKQEQIRRAEKLKAIQGWGAWPACTAKLGLR